MSYHYYVTYSRFDDTEREVTLDEFQAAERVAGFHGGSETSAATAGFSDSVTGIRGRVEYTKDSDQ